MNFFTCETQVSRGLSLIGRNSVLARQRKAGTSPIAGPRSLLGLSSPPKSGSRRSAQSPWRRPGHRRGDSASLRGRDSHAGSSSDLGLGANGGGPSGELDGTQTPASCNNSRCSESPARACEEKRGYISWASQAKDDGRGRHRSCGNLDLTVDASQVSEEPTMLDQSPEEPEALWLAQRREESCREALRVLLVEKSNFSSLVDWAFTVLGIAVEEHSLQSVQKSYRSLMKKLHPDKSLASPGSIGAVEIVQEAKAICERSLSRLDVPSAPENLVSTMTCARVGKRRFGIRWSAPKQAETVPPQRYVVATTNIEGSSKPPHRLCTLEPDYSKELGRFVTLDELRRYELSEEEMDVRIPGIFKQKAITVMVAAANKAGYSAWASVTLELDPPPLSAPRATSPTERPQIVSPSASPTVPRRNPSPFMQPLSSPRSLSNPRMTQHSVTVPVSMPIQKSTSPSRCMHSTGATISVGATTTTTSPCTASCTTTAPGATSTHNVTTIQGVASSCNVPVAVQFAPLSPPILRFRTVA